MRFWIVSGACVPAKFCVCSGGGNVTREEASMLARMEHGKGAGHPETEENIMVALKLVKGRIT